MVLIIFNPLIKSKISTDIESVKKTCNKSKEYFIKVEKQKSEFLMYLN